MAMSRKHYTDVAEIVKSNLAAAKIMDTMEEADAAKAILRSVASDLASFFKRDNSAFDRQRFLTACGL